MPFQLTMPKLSPTMEGGTIVKWHKKEGDTVKEGDLLFEVATDKATVEHNALDGGILRKIIVAEGASANVNEAVAILSESADDNIDEFLKPTQEKQATPQEETKQEDAPKPQIATASFKTFGPEAPLDNYTYEFPTSPFEGRTFASPLAKRLAKEKGIDLKTVKGTGPNERIMSRDLDLGQPDKAVTFGRNEKPTIPPGTFEEIPLTPMRKAIGEKLQASKMTVPHFYIQQDIHCAALVETREQLKASGIKLTFNDFIVRATALALREHPEMNRGFNSKNNTIIDFKTIDIAIAVAIPDGLITPIIRHTDFKDLGQISTEVKQLATLAQDGKLAEHQYKGGSFTISNLGRFDIHDFQAVINPPQAAILAIGSIQDRPIIHKSKVVPGKVMTLSLSSDHRVIDGALAAQFLKTVQKYLENPLLLLL